VLSEEEDYYYHLFYLTSSMTGIVSAHVPDPGSSTEESEARRQPMRKMSPFLLGIFLLLLGTTSKGQNIITTLAGGGSLNGTALTADLGVPTGVARDALGNTYITSFSEHTVFKLTPSGQWSVFAGIGRFGYSGDGGLATNAALYYAAGIAIDSSGNVYIADRGNQRVRRVDAATGIITTYAGNGSAGIRGQPNGDGGSATSASLQGPRALTFDSVGNLYIADTDGDVIRKVDNTPQHIITTYVGNGTVGARLQPNGDGGPATSASLNFPRGVAVDSLGNLYIADTRDQRIRKVDTSSPPIITTYAGNGVHGTPGQANGDGGPATSANLFSPRGVAIDSHDNLYIADTADQVVRKVDTSAQHVIITVAGNGTATFAGDGGPALSASLNWPFALSIDSAGTIEIVDLGNLRVRMVDANANISVLAGGGNGGDGGLATNAILAGPVELALDSAGNLFISDSDNQRIRRVSAGNAPTISTHTGSGITAGTFGNGVPALSAALSAPAGLAFDTAGNLFFVNGSINDLATQAQVVQRVDALSGTISIVAGDSTGVGGPSPCALTTDPCGDGGPGVLALFGSPWGMAVDASGNIFISDIFLNRVRRVDATTNTITTIAGTGNPCANPTTACGDGGLATNANLTSPYGLAFDPSGNLLIVDSGDNKVRRVNSVGGVITAASTISTVAFSGASTFGGNGGPALNASLIFPLDVRADSAGNLFISGSVDNVVQRVDAISGTIATVAGDVNNLAGGFSGDGGPATQASLGIFGLTIDNTGGLYIADQANNRIRYVHLTPVATITGTINDFGLQGVGVKSSAQTITLTNSGGDSLLITSVIAAGNFATTNTCANNEVGPMTNCAISVTFTPLSAGPLGASLTITTNDPVTPVQVFNLSGTGVSVGGASNPSTTSLIFAAQALGTTSPPQAVTLTNTGNGPLTITSIIITGTNPNDFSQTNNCPLSPATLGQGANCILLVSFMPIASGARTTTITITDDQGGIPGSQQAITLNGTGLEPPPAASTTYRIRGNPFTTFQGAATCPPSCNVAGSFTLSQSLAANLSNATITPSTFSFYVGPVVLDQNSATGASFTGIYTDASGSITHWSISISNANYTITTNNPFPNAGAVGDTFQVITPFGLASNSNSPTTWPQTITVPATFNPGSNVSNVATIYCPSGTTPCTDPNAHSIKLAVDTVTSAFTLSITAVEVPDSEANGVCQKSQSEVTALACRFLSTFAGQLQPNGDTVVPLCIPYSNGNCVFYHIGNVPAFSSYQGSVGEYIAWNNATFVPPATYQADNPRLYYDPDYPPYDVNHQFVFDITNYYEPSGALVGIDPGIGGRTKHFSDFVVAYPLSPNTTYTYTWAGALRANRVAHFEAGDSIPVRFRVSPDTPAGVVMQAPNRAGYSVMLDKNGTGCADFSGVRQPTVTRRNAATDFTYDPIQQEYELRLQGTFHPGAYKLLVTSNLFGEQCAPFVVTKD
jgi:trimeric autotransporter adhesin